MRDDAGSLRMPFPDFSDVGNGGGAAGRDEDGLAGRVQDSHAHDLLARKESLRRNCITGQGESHLYAPPSLFHHHELFALFCHLRVGRKIERKLQ